MIDHSRASLKRYYQNLRWLITFLIFFISIIFLASFAIAKEIKQLVVSDHSDLKIVNAVDKTEGSIGDIFTYSIKVENAGPSVAKLIRFKNVLPPNLDFYSASVSTLIYDPATRQLSYNLDQLAAGGFQTIIIKVKATNSGIAANTAVVTAQTADPILNNNISTAEDVIISVRPRRVINNPTMESVNEEPVLVSITSDFKMITCAVFLNLSNRWGLRI